MRDGDLSNAELPRMWMVVEGLVLIPTGAPVKKRNIRDGYVLNTFMYKRVWDIVWRHDIRVNLITFNVQDWADQARMWLDEVDFPAPVYNYTVERFMDEIVTLPSCIAVYDPSPRRALMYGRKGVHVDPHFDFDLFAI